MLPAVRDRIEREVKGRCEAADLAGAATLALRGYGPEIYGFLLALHRDEDEAAEVFSTFGEKLWRGLARFSWTCSLRTWAYTIARNASRDLRRGARRDAKRVPLSDARHVAQQVRTETRSSMKTERKERFARLRASLPAEDQMLLILRVDRGLEWIDLARIIANDGTVELDDLALKRAAARLRKRFQLLKERLVERGKREGLVRRTD